MKVGIDIFDYKFLKIINFAPKNDLAVMFVVFFLTVFVDLIVAVGVGILLASMLIVYRISIESKIKIEFHKDDLHEVGNEHLRILNINGAFFFGSASLFEDQIDNILDTKKLVVNCSNVPFIDISAIFALEEMILKLQDLDIEVVLVLKHRHMRKINRIDKMKIFEKVKIYNKIEDAL